MLQEHKFTKVLDKDLNVLSEIDHVFEPNKHYVVCRTLISKNLLGIEKQVNDNQNNADENTNFNEDPPKYFQS